MSIPPTRWAEPVWELIRLVRLPDTVVPLTKLISLTMGAVRRAGMDLVVSYADQTQGHYGYVYRASNWNYHGYREPRNTGVIIDGRYTPGRTANSVFGTRSVAKLAAQGIEAEAVFDDGKHLYWKAIAKTGKEKAARLGLESNPWKES